MAKAERFYPRIIDRTPYGACWIAALLGIAFFLLGFSAIIRAASWLGNTGIAQSLHKNNLEYADKNKDLLDAASKAAEDAANSARTSAQEAATKKIEEEQEKARQAAIEEVKNQLQIILPTASPTP